MDFINKNIKWILIGVCAVVIASVFLPYIVVSINFLGQSMRESASYFKGYQWQSIVVMITAAVAGVLVFFKLGIFALIPLAVGLGLFGYNSINIGKEFVSIAGLGKISFGVGFYLILLGFIVAIGGILYEFLVLKKKKNVNAVSNEVQNPQPLGVSETVSPTSYNKSFVAPVPEVSNDNTNQIDNNQRVIINESSIGLGVNNVNDINNNVNQEPVQINELNFVQEEPVNNSVPTINVSCPNCGASNPGNNFCTECGTKIN